MRYAALLVAGVAGFASQTSAQNFVLTIVPSSTTIADGDSFSLSVYGNADVGTHLLGGAFSLNSENAVIDSITWNPAAWSQFNTDGGYAGNGNYNQVIFGQLVIPGIFPPAPNSELGSLIGAFQVNTVAGGVGYVDFHLIAGSPFTLESVDSITGHTFQSSTGDLTLGSTSVLVYPTPGVLSGFAVCALVRTRRRR